MTTIMSGKWQTAAYSLCIHLYYRESSLMQGPLVQSKALSVHMQLLKEIAYDTAVRSCTCWKCIVAYLLQECQRSGPWCINRCVFMWQRLWTYCLLHFLVCGVLSSVHIYSYNATQYQGPEQDITNVIQYETIWYNIT